MEGKRVAAIIGIIGALIGLGYAIYNYVMSNPQKSGNTDSLAKAREAKAKYAQERKTETDEEILSTESGND